MDFFDYEPCPFCASEEHTIEELADTVASIDLGRDRLAQLASVEASGVTLPPHIAASRDALAALVKESEEELQDLLLDSILAEV